ncbi:hypothetical protein BDW74DRAFT_73784 [Aspergillus multicolor]|uniref:uncharacterized protein n=1 Tax=Aspergillus multicolor TaxID=41759 RepID=UPI003CCE1916
MLRRKTHGTDFWSSAWSRVPYQPGYDHFRQTHSIKRRQSQCDVSRRNQAYAASASSSHRCVVLLSRVLWAELNVLLTYFFLCIWTFVGAE